MRILKYIFLLLLLAFVGMTVFVTTQKGNYDVSRSKIIKTPRTIVFDYVNDYRNWETFGAWMDDDKEIIFDYPTKTMGIGGSYFWKEKDGNGSMKTVFVKENEALSQKMIFNGSKSDVFWTFKDTVGGTKVTWRHKGKMDFMTKIYSFFSGGINSVLGNRYEKSLYNLNRTLDYEMKTYAVKVNGIVQRNSGFYLKQSVTCRMKSVSKNIRIMMPRMVSFFKKNQLPMIGKPFVLYDRYDISNDIVTLSVCMPVSKKINITSGSDVSSGELLPFTSLKTTLVGDYSHCQEAWEKAKKHIVENGLKENFSGRYVEVYSKTIDDVKNPSKWITEIYIPVFPKAVTPQPVVSSMPTPSIPTVVANPETTENP
jgi:predicted transcriptional regulator YdeE